MKTVLITGMGGDIAQSIATILTESRPTLRLIGADMSDRHAGSLFVDQLCLVPGARSEDYVSSIKVLIKKHSIDLIIPTTEQELSALQPVACTLKSGCIMAGSRVIDIGIDKLRTIEFIASLGIPTPWTVSAKDNVPRDFPCIFKSQKGSGSKNVFLVESKEEALFLAGKFPDSIFQELLKPDDKEITCAVYRDKSGKVSVLQLLRELLNGATGWAMVISNNEVFEMCKKVAESINLQGSMNIQLRLTENGPRIFEINPRFSSTVLMRHRIGFCDLLWAIDEEQGERVEFPKIEVGQHIVRVQNARKLNN